MKQIKRKRLPEALVQALGAGNEARSSARRAVISVAVGMCIAGAVHAQSADGNIMGKAKGGASVTLTAPGGRPPRPRPGRTVHSPFPSCRQATTGSPPMA
jgi:hypothetical protein